MNLSSVPLRQTSLGLVAPLVRGRTVLLVGAAAHSTQLAAFFKAASAAHVDSVMLDYQGDNTQGRFAAYEATLRSPPTDLRSRLEMIDPHRSAFLYAGSFASVREVDGRPVLGARTAVQADAERKDMQARLVGGTVCSVELNWGVPAPTVIQGIPRQGLAMSSSHTYIVPKDASSDNVAALKRRLGRDCDTVVLRPLHTGIPCTFYGFLARNWVVEFGPVEALVFWDQRTWRVHAPGIVWPLELSASELENARSAIQTLGRRLHRNTSYAGAFGVDGVIQDGIYRIHEINPRVCAGFSLLDQIAPDSAPLAAVDLCLRDCGDQAAEQLADPLEDLARSLRSTAQKRTRIFDGGITPISRADAFRIFRSQGLIPVSDVEEYCA